jgi:hypothetical protein
MLFNQKSTTREVLLLTKFHYLTNSGVEFLGTIVQYLLVFSTNISIHSAMIIGNSPKKISCSSVYTYLFIHCLLLIRGFLFSFRENYCSFISIHSMISFLVSLQNIPSVKNSFPRQQNNLLARGCKTLGSVYSTNKPCRH